LSKTGLAAVCVLLAFPPLAGAAILYESTGLPGTGTAPNGRFSWHNDSQQGRVLQVEVLDAAGGKERAEFVATGRDNRYKDKTVFIGWKSRLDMPAATGGNWCVIMQGFAAGQRDIVHPFDLRVDGGKLYLVRWTGQGNDHRTTIWSRTIPSRNTWFSIVMKVRYSTSASTGYVELWYNGAKQTFANGSQTMKMQTWDGVDNNIHWGIYRSGGVNGTGHHYMKNVRIATTYNEAVP